jgi:hypothetical protein
MSDSSKFNSIKYSLPILDTKSSTSTLTDFDPLTMTVPTFVDIAGTTDGIANNAEAVLSFQHTPSGKDVFFKAFVETFTETYSSNFNEETVFGRTDPIVTFKNTTKRITLSWKIPAETISEAYENLQKVQNLSQFLYPSYESVSNALSLSQTPLIRLKVMNLASKIRNGGTDPNSAANAGKNVQFAQIDSYRSTNSSDQGLLGVITSMSVDHNLGNMDIGVVQTQTNTILPKMIFVSIDFMAIHEETLGWRKTNGGTKFNASNFPYNMSEIDELLPEDYDKYGMGSTLKYQMMENRRRKREAKEQACANSQASMEKNAQMAANRYAGMFGGVRQNRDRRRVAKLLEKKSSEGELSKRKQAKLNALSDIQSGRNTNIEATMRANGCYDNMGSPDGGTVDASGDDVDFGALE